MICTDLRELRETNAERERRVDAMLREMIVLEGLDSMSESRPPRDFTLEEIGDFVGVHLETIRRVEENALRKIKKEMVI